MSAQSPVRAALSLRSRFRNGAASLVPAQVAWPRVFDLMYWPAVQMLMWGFLQMWVAQNSGFFARAAGTSSER